MITKRTTEARPAPNNEIWEQEIDGQQYVCERPQYKNHAFDNGLLAECFANEGRMLFGKPLPFLFDAEGRWWVDPALGSQELLVLFLREPQRYFAAIAQKIRTVKSVIQRMRDVEPLLGATDPKQLLSNFRTLTQCHIDFYSYHFITYVVFDEIVLAFQKLLRQFLTKKEANEYLGEFLQAEITKEALSVGAIGESLQVSRDSFYSDAKPTIFYREPKLFFDSPLDSTIIAKLPQSPLSAELRQQFFALRLIAPVSIQISEEGQYVESKMLCPMLKITLTNIKGLFVQKGILTQAQDIRTLSHTEIAQYLEHLCASDSSLTLKGLGVSKGIVTGRVKLVQGHADDALFNADDILVTRLTDPTMVPMMNRAAGIVCEIGGMTSHPSIISRELGIPCVVAVHGVLEQLRDGDLVQINGGTGEVIRLSNSVVMAGEHND